MSYQCFMDVPSIWYNLTQDLTQDFRIPFFMVVITVLPSVILSLLQLEKIILGIGLSDFRSLKISPVCHGSGKNLKDCLFLHDRNILPCDNASL